ncbi:hypothetical protein [Acinetobacter indicus]|uniref:Uncharacterized protein n=1 Tax=Acinetobacter indicus TaxID=756892 RepID=A0AAW8Z5S1_9GAMM|nr:hypothetical protein [Acinetobacter indicus]MCO8088337.1 hypothetical protein [Acinetobacter indicus]MCO8100743.1 hypothetical protein [Acinetobacter indicus]MCO8102731.1 hypothetical protein [Acinetobacter indicus]MCO8106282.1 hypothetical protein [Acinetobacter indicus]MCO8111946.1 hypothetical protein [Acinetobacter indicus]
MKQNDIQRPGSLIKATLISSLAAPLPFVVTILANLILSEDFQVPELTQLFGFLLIIMLFALPFTCTINFVLVLPIALLLSRINSLSAIYLCLWCSLIAFPAFAIYMRILNGGSTREFDFLAIILTTLCGLCSGIVFCRIAKIRWLCCINM